MNPVFSLLIKTAVRKKKRHEHLPTAGLLAGGLLGASAPTAALGQYLANDYPKYEETLTKAPIFEDFEHLPKLQPGDIEVNLDKRTNPFTTALGVSGSPAGHSSMLITPPNIPNYTNKDLVTLSGGWVKPDKINDIKDSFVTKNIFDRIGGAKLKAELENPHASGIELLKKTIHNFKQQSKEAPKYKEELKEFLNHHPVTDAMFNFKKYLDDNAERKSPMILLRPKIPVEKQEEFNRLIQNQAAESYGKPYSTQKAVATGIGRVLFPQIGFHTNKATYESIPTANEYCAIPAANVLKATGNPVSPGNPLPTDFLKAKNLDVLGIVPYHGMTTQYPNKEEIHKTILQWLKDNKADRVKLGLGSILGLGAIGALSGAGVGYGLKKYLERKKSKKNNKAS